jgi:nucleoside-diphosphate-sugar epimerase
MAQPTPATDWSAFPLTHLRGQQVLVTGGAGFIGSHLTHALAQLECKITVLDDLSGGGAPAALPPTVKFIKGSILDQPLLDDCTAGCRFVFHQAALGSVPRSLEQPRQYTDVNVIGTLNVLEAARKAQVQRILFAASSSAYGDNPTLPKNESMPSRPLSPYAATKICGEALMTAWAAGFSVDTVCLRYFNIFGPRQNPDSAYAAVIAAFAKALLSNRRPTIFGDGRQTRDFTYVDNVVLANLLATKVETRLNGTVINIALGQSVTINDLARDMADMLDRPDLTPIHEPARSGDVVHSLADISKARTILNYQPIVPFRTGLQTTTDWYRKHTR